MDVQMLVRKCGDFPILFMVCMCMSVQHHLARLPQRPKSYSDQRTADQHFRPGGEFVHRQHRACSDTEQPKDEYARCVAQAPRQTDACAKRWTTNGERCDRHQMIGPRHDV
jgi:hypothetical protein